MLASRYIPRCYARLLPPYRSSPRQFVPRLFTTTRQNSTEKQYDESVESPSPPPPFSKASREEYVRGVREQWGDKLPEGLLSKTEFEIYRRFYGAPVRLLSSEEIEEMELGVVDELDGLQGRTVTLQDKDGVEVFDGVEEEGEEVQVVCDSVQEAEAYGQLKKDMEVAYRPKITGEIEVEEEIEHWRRNGDPKGYVRTHPLTSLGTFATSPVTIFAPDSITVPTTDLLSEVKKPHLDEVAYKIFGGQSLPRSPIMTGKLGKRYNGISLNILSDRMSDMEADVYLATVMPGAYAQALSALTELRRRLGGDWVLGNGGTTSGVKKVMDVGTAGAGILAWKSIVEAQQASRKDTVTGRSEGSPEETSPEEPTKSQPEDVAFEATVVTGSESMRYRASKFLENTTFLRRLPGTAHSNLGLPSALPDASQPRKTYDLVIATNSILPIFEAYKRKNLVNNLWSLVNPNGGVLLLIEKGNPGGFEAIAEARSMILKHKISSPGKEFLPLSTTGRGVEEEEVPKETGMIIAPCTNHEECPMFVPDVPKRRDYCRFSQRYQRPDYLQRILKATKTNHDDLEYSYVAFRRGFDIRKNQEPAIDPKVEEFDMTTTPARSPYSNQQLRRHAFTLPRTILPPIKRQGHVIIDLCTPAGKIERWTVPKSYGKIEFRDARKSRWGDLWALGAKTKVTRTIKALSHQYKPKKEVTKLFDEYGDVITKVTKSRRDGPKPKKRPPTLADYEKKIMRRERRFFMEGEKAMAGTKWMKPRRKREAEE